MNIFIGELIGTMVLILLGDGVVANVVLAKSKGQNSGWIVISAGWGFGVAIAVYIAGWASGAHINPAVTLGLAVVGDVSPEVIPTYLAGQFLGAFLGAVLVWLAYLPHWAATDNPDGKLGVFCTTPAIRHTLGNLLCEVIGTAVLLMGVLGIANKYNGLGSGVGPYLVGILVFEHRSVAGRSDRLRDQPRAGSRPAVRPCPAAHPRQARLGLGLRLDSHRRADPRRRARRDVVLPPVFRSVPAEELRMPRSDQNLWCRRLACGVQAGETPALFRGRGQAADACTTS